MLASAICKTARGALQAPALSLGGGIVARRARLLLEADPEAKPPRAHPGLVALAPLMVALVLVGALALPFAAHAGYHEKHRLGTPHDVLGPHARHEWHIPPILRRASLRTRDAGDRRDAHHATP